MVCSWYMNKLIFAAWLVICTNELQSCNGNDMKNKDSVDSAVSVNDSIRKNTDTSLSNLRAEPVRSDAIGFAVKAASGSMMEITLGRIAMQKAESPRVKDFGSMMVRDHTKALDDLKARARALNIILPADAGDEDQKMIDEALKKNGKDFDNTYMTMMLRDHEKNLAAYRRVSDKCSNASLKEFAYRTLLILEVHMDSAQSITGKK